ncbi:hypothetical protein ACFPMF_26605 [Larkinella bovis]|uniref:DUF3592 domain-containing protein n=1 Tax=Larkinella bovis TaxID=683041 RepID=A0ABW0IKT5_9BACT
MLLAFTPLLLLLAAAPRMYSIYQRKQIRKESVVTVGTVSHFELVKTRYWQYYRANTRFLVNEKSFVGKSRVIRTLSEGQLQGLRGETLPVIYEKGNPSNNVVLSTEEKFSQFEFMFPDSLHWTRQYFY